MTLTTPTLFTWDAHDTFLQTFACSLLFTQAHHLTLLESHSHLTTAPVTPLPTLFMCPLYFTQAPTLTLLVTLCLI